MRLVGRTGLKPIGLSVSSLALFNYHAFDLMPFEKDEKKKKDAADEDEDETATAVSTLSGDSSSGEGSGSNAQEGQEKGKKNKGGRPKHSSGIEKRWDEFDQFVTEEVHKREDLAEAAGQEEAQVERGMEDEEMSKKEKIMSWHQAAVEKSTFRGMRRGPRRRLPHLLKLLPKTTASQDVQSKVCTRG